MSTFWVATVADGFSKVSSITSTAAATLAELVVLDGEAILLELILTISRCQALSSFLISWPPSLINDEEMSVH